MQEYLHARDARRTAVDSTVFTVCSRARIGGSWRRGDFHLDRRGETLSDLDLVLEGSSDIERAQVASDVRGALAAHGVRVKVSVHPSDSFVSMPLAEQRYFNLLEYFNVEECPSHRYRTAKTALMLVRLTARESAVEAGLRTRMDSELRVKIGCDDEEDRVVIGDDLAGLEVDGKSAGAWIVDPVEGVRLLIEHFDGRARRGDGWIYRRAATKARDVAAALSSSRAGSS